MINPCKSILNLLEYSIFFLLLFVLVSCAATKPYIKKEENKAPPPQILPSPEYTVFLVGDAGEASADPLDPVLVSLKNELEKTGEKSVIVFLGDNIYPQGMPDSTEDGRREAERRITAQMDILKNYKGRIVFVPGNHDWKRGKKGGWHYLLNEESFIENYLERGNVFLPDSACPGPVEVPLADDLVLIVIDTQWWLHRNDKPGKEDCEIASDEDFLLLLNDALLRNSNKRIIVAAHHPLYSNGQHGGKFSWKSHIFPLTAVNSSLYIPLPVIGSIYPGYRSVVGSIQDIPNDRYQFMKRVLLDAFKPYRNLIYVSGHEHNLQYFNLQDQHFIVSGSGSKTNFVAKRHKAEFAHRANGFSRIDFYTNNTTELSFIEPEGDGTKYSTVYENVFEQSRGNPEVEITEDSLTGVRSVEIQANKEFAAGKFKRWFLGAHYRDEWTKTVQVKVLDLENEKGGLTPTRRGGGHQTKSLRLDGGDGKEYVIRSVKKYPEDAVPPIMRGTIAVDLVRDQISSAHPYAAVTIPGLAAAAGVYHTNPEMVFVPKSKRLGVYMNDFGNTFCLFEERVSGNQEDAPNFGNAKEILNTPKMLEKVFEDNDHRVDQIAFLKARLFDIWIGDWDRHEDQWVWAEKKKDDKTIYEPIPRDRDQVYTRFDGFLPKLLAKPWLLNYLQDFGEEIKHIGGFNFSPRFIDRNLLNEPALDQWMRVAEALRKDLTDEVIEKAIHRLPPEVFDISGPRIIAMLKARRSTLKKWAQEYYLFLAENVDVTGTDDDELFEVKRMNDEETLVRVFKIKKSGEIENRPLYSRVFRKSETKEIRLYGLGGKDEFDIDGKVRRGIRIRIIGGKGHDKFEDKSFVGGGGHKTKIYDTPGNDITPSRETRIFISEDPAINTYNRRMFKYDWLAPRFAPGYNPDDGIYFGGGVTFRRQQWRKLPFGYELSAWGNHSLLTNSYNFWYEGNFIHLLGNWDLGFRFNLNAPNYILFYYGAGNETKMQEGKKKEYYRVRSNQIGFATSLKNNFAKYQTIEIRPSYYNTKIESQESKFISDGSSGIDSSVYSRKHFGVLSLLYDFSNTNNKLLPAKGVHFTLSADFSQNLKQSSRTYSRIAGSFAFYLPFKKLVVANRTGYEASFGKMEFYQLNNLGGTENLRGYRRDRFAGNKVFYNNTELRVQLKQVQGYLFKGKIGLLALMDHGRVWQPGEKSLRWHSGYGGGIWLAPFDKLALTGTYSASEEDTYLNIKLGFLF